MHVVVFTTVCPCYCCVSFHCIIVSQFFTHVSVDEHMTYFQFKSIINKADIYVPLCIIILVNMYAYYYWVYT